MNDDSLIISTVSAFVVFVAIWVIVFFALDFALNMVARPFGIEWRHSATFGLLVAKFILNNLSFAIKRKND